MFKFKTIKGDVRKMNKQVQFINRIDEKGRFCGLEAQLIPAATPVMQRDSKVPSYVNLRALYSSYGHNIGLSKSNVEYTLRRYGVVSGIQRFKYNRVM